MVVLALYYAVIGVAIASLTDRRIVAGAAVIGLLLITSISSGIIVGDIAAGTGSIAALINVLSLPLYLRDLIFLGHIDPDSPLTGVANGGAARGRDVSRVLFVGSGVLLLSLPMGGALMSTARRRRAATHAEGQRPLDDPAFAVDATVEIADVSVWFGPKVALSELSCSFGPGVTGLLGPNGAGKTTLMRAMTGLVGVNQGTVRVEGRNPRRDREVHGRMALVPEDEAVPAGLTARQLVRYTADLLPRGRPERAGQGTAECRDARRRRSSRRRLQQGDASAHKDRRRAGHRSAGARA